MAKDLLVNYDGKPSYYIHLRAGFNDFCGLLEQNVPKKYSKVCIVTDSHVANLYLNEVQKILENNFDVVISYIFEAGESSKNIDVVLKLYEELILNHFDRGDLLVALGGGVVGDLTGFTASTYLRGIDFVQVPTTLLSQVDSSIGGKTGVDFLSYKNMVGAFYMPKMVYMNINALSTLDDYNFACGMGEVVKSALIQNADFYSWLKENARLIKAKNFDTIEQLVFECCKIKKYVVEEDPKEKGIRAYLNFGHTIGHAVEKLANFSIGHGQCVGIGMVAASYLSNKLGKISDVEVADIISTIKLFDMPVSVTNMDANSILLATKSDKKMQAGKIKFTVLSSVGVADSYLDFSDEDLLEAINYILE